MCEMPRKKSDVITSVCLFIVLQLSRIKLLVPVTHIHTHTHTHTHDTLTDRTMLRDE